MKKQFSINEMVRRLGFWILIGGVFFITIIILLSDFGKVAAAISKISLPALASIICAVLFNYALRFAKWQFFLRKLEIKIPLRENLWVFFSAFTMVLSPGKLGELIKSWLLKSRFMIPVSRTAPIVFAERLTDLIGLLILCSIGFSRFAFGGKTLVILGCILFVGIILMTRKGFWDFTRKFILRFEKLKKLEKIVDALQESTQNLLSFSSILITAPLSAISWAGEGFALFLIFKSLGVDKPDLLAIAIFAHAFSSIVGAISFLPGGLLVTEGALGMFFLFVSIDKTTALTATFLIRAVTLWFAVLLGTVVFIGGHRKADLSVIGSESESESEKE